MDPPQIKKWRDWKEKIQLKGIAEPEGLNFFLFELVARLRIQNWPRPETRVSFLIEAVS